jgi:oligopeptidase B
MRKILIALVAVGSCCPMEGAPRQTTTPPTIEPKPQPVVTPPVAPVPTGPVAPVAAKKPYDVKSPHGTRNDPYYWLRDDTRKNADVIAYLDAEKAYANAILAPEKAVEDKLFSEMRSRIKEDDSSVPTFDDGYWYYARYEAGKQYPIFARKKVLTGPEQIVLDVNALAEGHSFYTVGAYVVSRNGKLVAYAEDTVGRRQYVLRVKDLETGKLLPDTAENIAGDIVWANDNKTLFYAGKDPTTLREDRVFRLALGGKPEQIFEEKDTQYYVSVDKTKSKKYVEIFCDATTNSESRVIDADKPKSAARVLVPRSKDHIYFMDHLDGSFYFRTNKDAKNFRVVKVADAQASNVAAWKDVVPHRPDVLVERFVIYRNWMAATIRSGGLRKVEVRPAKGDAYLVDAPDPTYAMIAQNTPDPASKKLRFGYDSMTRPNSVFEMDITTKKRELLKQQPVPGYDPEQYTSEYLHATAGDGTQVPISVVYKKTTKLDGSAPAVVYGYGSYGISMEPRFNNGVVSLLDRGFVYAIAHIRGGQEMGRQWYEDGKLMKKVNTFTDFIAATEHLVKGHYVARDHVFAYGGSAGG